MMELRHIAMVNWHLFDVEDIEITGHTGVFGENRSGKSTILDMAQVVLTGGNRNVQRLNAVAGDKGRSRSASKRSVVDYCLGALGEDQRKREQARTYICLGFADTEGKRPAVSIGMAIEARRSESNETILGRFVVTGKILTADDFIQKRDGKRFSGEWDDVRSRIISAVGQENFVNHRDKAIDYVREYMRRLVPHASVVGEQNANSLQKAVVNAMTLDHDQTATEFVRNYILEKNNMKLAELRESIRTYRNINETIKTMREKLDTLLALQIIVGELAAVHERKACEQWIAKRGSWLAARAAYAAQLARFTDETVKRDAAKAEIDFLDEELEGIDAEILRLERAIAEHDTKTGRNSLVQSLASAAQGAQRSTTAFEQRLDQVRALQPLCAMKAFGFDEFIPAISGLARAAQDAAIDRSSIALLDLESGLLSVDRSLRPPRSYSGGGRRKDEVAAIERSPPATFQRRRSRAFGTSYRSPVSSVTTSWDVAPRPLRFGRDRGRGLDSGGRGAPRPRSGGCLRRPARHRPRYGTFQGRTTRVPRGFLGQFEQARRASGTPAVGHVSLAFQNR